MATIDNFQDAASAAPRGESLVGPRAAAYLLDVIPAAVFALMVGWIPVVGAMFAGLILTPYWLLRDITGGSLGKLLVGLRVSGLDGQPATVGSRILRNLPLAVGLALLLIPLAGYILAPLVAIPIFLTETVLTVSFGQRLGDKLARTVVVRKRS